MNVYEIDAASNNGVENIRDIIDDTNFTPAQGKYKVYIIDEVHMLSTGAFNALLKTLEEPPEYVIFILATTEVHKIPLTIMSRCQRYDFKRISVDTITARLQELIAEEGLQAEEKALRYIAKCADGAMRDALSLLDQCLAFQSEEVLTYEQVLQILGAVDAETFSQLLRHVVKGEVIECIHLLDRMVTEGRDLTQFVSEFTWYLRNLMLLKASDNAKEVIDMSAENLARLVEEAEMVEMDTITRYIRVMSELSGKLRATTQKRVTIEVTLIKLCRPEMESRDDSLLDRIRVLEEKMENGIPMMANVGSATSAQMTQETPRQTLKKAPLPAALPEDVQKVVQNWRAVLKQLGQPGATYLSNCMVSMDNENRLCLVTAEAVSRDWLNESVVSANPAEGETETTNLDMIKTLIGNLTGTDMEVVVKFEADRMTAESKYPDLSNMIQMDIEEVEEIEE
jgi:DNA polymerase-3 subunit gamma/tau